MSFFKQARAKAKAEETGIFTHENPKAVAALHERMGQPFQAVRVRLWNGLPQREHHRGMVERWQNSRLADEYPPPPVPQFIPGPPAPDNSEEARLDRALAALRAGQVGQGEIDRWPPRWRQVGATQGYLTADGKLRAVAKEG